MKKPRSDSKLLNLPEEQQAQLAELLLGGMSYTKAKAVVQKKFGCSCSLSALSDFWESVCAPEILRRRSRSVKMSDEFAELVKKQPGSWDKVLLDQVKQKAFDMANDPNFKAESLFFLMQLVLKGRDQDLKKADISLKRDKFEFDAAKAALKFVKELKSISRDPSLDENAKVQAARLKLFGVLPS